MNQETKLQLPAAAVPRPQCSRCDDWTTIVVETTVAPCPVCRASDYKAWLDDGNRLPRS